MLDFSGTHVFITGASGGVGLAVAAAFLQLGARVSLHANTNADAAAPLVAKNPQHARADVAAVGDEAAVCAAVGRAVAAFGAIGVLVVCHGIWPSADVAVKDMALSQWKNTISVNLDGTFLFVREYLKQLDDAVKAGVHLPNVAVVMVGSTAGKFGEAYHADYSCSKSAMMYGLTLSLKNEIVKIHPRGRVNTVSPGWIRTPMAERAMQNPSLLYQALASSPLKKVSEPDDIARAILFLSSSAMSGNITGLSLDVNAGMEGRLLNQPSDFGIKSKL
ncbi:NAD-P-binding protein [Obelidium mucronatum]|nr:NAD-P-binding protein [Obelidium mucronatum]